MKNVSKKDMIAKIYLYGINEQFSDLSDMQKVVKLWDAAVTRATTVPTVKPTGTALICLDWLRHRLTTGRIFAAAPSVLRIVSYTDYEVHSEAAIELNDILGLCTLEQLADVPAPDLPALTYFKVLNPYPNRRYLKHPYHLGCRPSVIAIVQYTVEKGDYGQVRLKPAHKASYLDLSYCSSGRFAELVESLWCFHGVQHGSRLNILPRMLTACDQDAPVRNAPTAMAAWNSLMEATDNQLQLQDYEQLPTGNQLKHAIETLAMHDIVSTSRDEGGAITTIKPNFDAVHYVPLVALSQPSLEFNIAEKATCVTQRSKLDLVSTLCKQGFEPSWDCTRYWEMSGPTVFRAQALSGSKLYFVALILRDEIAPRSKFILHNGTARYYRLLLSLKDLSPLSCLRDDDKAMSEQEFAALEDPALQEPLVPITSLTAAASDAAEDADDHSDGILTDDDAHFCYKYFYSVVVVVLP